MHRQETIDTTVLSPHGFEVPRQCVDDSALACRFRSVNESLTLKVKRIIKIRCQNLFSFIFISHCQNVKFGNMTDEAYTCSSINRWETLSVIIMNKTLDDSADKVLFMST